MLESTYGWCEYLQSERYEQFTGIHFRYLAWLATLVSEEENTMRSPEAVYLFSPKTATRSVTSSLTLSAILREGLLIVLL